MIDEDLAIFVPNESIVLVFSEFNSSDYIREAIEAIVSLLTYNICGLKDLISASCNQVDVVFHYFYLVYGLLM
jgi:hypothetical protein